MMRGFLLAALCGLLLGCQSMPSGYKGLGQPRQVAEFVARHRELAERFEAQGAWRAALREWQIIDAVSTGDADVDRQLRRLNGEVERRFVDHRDAAEVAAKLGRYREAQRQWLAALALRPDSHEAIASMKAVEARLAYAAMPAEPEVAKGPQSEVEVYTAQRKEAVVQGVSTGSPSEPRVRAAASAEKVSSAAVDLERRAADRLAEGRYEDALKDLMKLREMTGADPAVDLQITKLSQTLAEQHYTRGVAAFRDARFAEAVDEFARALRYNPDHHKARFYHSSAEALSQP